MGQTLVSSAILALAVASARAASIQYVTDMPIFSDLVPCAQSAVSYGLQAQTNDKCPEGATELQSCICTKNNNLASIRSKVSVSISYSCGSQASDEQTSAQSVLSAYCDPNLTVTFATPTAVNAYITDMPEIDYLAPCAKSAIAWAIRTLTYDLCPTDAPALASCACKSVNSRVVSSIISTSAKYSCSGHTADISSAQAMFAAYCGMNAGTTSFPVPAPPPGDMTYYITDLPQYSALAGCAKSGLSYAVNSQTYYLCPSGPQALASCACLKDGMPNEVSKMITSSVKYECSSTATDDVSSAIAVYNFYCSAANAQVTATGVSNSVEQTYPESRSNGPQQTGGSGSGSGSGSGGGNSGSSGSGGSSQGSNTSSSGPKTGVIVGAVVGVVGGLALIGAIIFFVIRHVRKNRPDSLRIPDNAPGGDPPVPLGAYGGKSELPSDSIATSPPPPSPSPSTLKPAAVPARADTVSPVSANTAAFTPPPNQAELSGQSSSLYPPMPNRPELHSQTSGTPPPPELYGQAAAPPPNRSELQGQGAMYPSPTPPPHNMSELQGQGTQFHNAAPNRPELAGAQYGYVQQQQQQQSPQMYPSPLSVQQQQQQGYHQQVYHHAGTPPPPQGGPGGGPGGVSGMYGQQVSWQSGPVPDLHEMDGGGHGMPQR